MNVIWNDNELKIIKQIINKFNFDLNDKNNIVEINRFNNNGIVGSRNIDKEDFERLFYIENKSDILKILKNSIGVKYIVKKHPDATVFHGLIRDIANIDPLDATEIFGILVSITKLYRQASMVVAIEVCNKFNNPDSIKCIINKIKNGSDESVLEGKVNKYINDRIKYTNGILNNNLFIPLIDKYNNHIKDNLILDLNKRLSTISKKIEHDNKYNVNDYTIKTIEKSRRKRPKYYSGEYNNS